MTQRSLGFFRLRPSFSSRLLRASGGSFNSVPPYLFEIKWDGERAIAFVENGKILRLQNRRLQDVSTRYPAIIGSPVEAKEAILDGEIVLLQKDGKPSFSKLLVHPSLLESLGQSVRVSRRRREGYI
jgi:bifunctional non-homologous end joining protein LigD